MRDDCAAVWEALHDHPFIRGLADGSLPPDRFRFFIEQNLQYLPEYGRTMAIAVSKAADLTTMRLFADDLAGVLDVEIPENHELLRRTLELGARDLGGTEGLAPANVAYTGFLISTAAQGDPVEIMAAVLPCTWSYGAIAARLVSAGLVHRHPVYTEWIRFYTVPPYTDAVERMKADFERMAAGAGKEKLDRLSELFTASVRLERSFWDMAYGAEHWPDVRARYPL
jgi:thiaminase/transcriptional activator TenA